MVKPAKEQTQIVPAEYGFEEKQVLVKQESERLEVIPATYKTVEEEVMVKPASKKVRSIPAQYKTVTEKVIDKPAHTTWKKGRGPIEKVNNSTGEIMCKVEVPATYKTIQKQVLVTPANTEEVEIPAVFKTVKSQVVDKPASVKRITVPAVHRTVKVQKEVKPVQVVKNTVPAVFKDVTSKIKVADSNTEWKPILCQTNMTRDKILKIQQTLQAQGYNPGDVDGVFGGDTQRAIRKYQAAKNISTGGLTMETLKSLGLNFAS